MLHTPRSKSRSEARRVCLYGRENNRFLRNHAGNYGGISLCHAAKAADLSCRRDWRSGGRYCACANVRFRREDPAFTTAFYAKGPTPNYGKLLEGFRALNCNKVSPPTETFTELWEVIQDGRSDGGSKLLRNGLTSEENRELMTTTDTMFAVQLIWKGLSSLFLETAVPGQTTKKK